jgi:iron complex outermembrane receptor protein
MKCSKARRNSVTHRTGGLVIATGLLCISSAAWSQDGDAQANQTQEIIVTGFKVQDTSSALKGDVPVRDIPLTVSAYSEEFIKELEVTQVADMYNYMVGVQRAGPTGYDISIRGFSAGGADRNSIQIDGLPGLAVRFGSPPTVNVAQVEVVKGPASVLYGQVQPGGFVNIITKKPQPNAAYTIGARAEGFYGAGTSIGDTFGWIGNADLTGPLNDSGSLAYRLVGEVQNRDGFVDNGFGKSYFVAPSASAQLGPDTDLLLQLEYQYSNTALYDGLVAPNNDITLVADLTTRYQEPDDYQKEEGYTGGITLEHHFSDNITWRTQARAVYHEDVTFGLQNLSFRNATTLRRQVRDQLNKREYYFGDSSLGFKFETAGIRHNLLLGVNGGRETSDFKRRNFDSGNASTDINIYDPVYNNFTPRAPIPGSWRYTTLDSIGVYLQDQIAFSDQFKAVAAVRWEKFNIRQEDRLGVAADVKTSGDRISPMVGVIFQPDRRWSFYASYATSFSPPSPGAEDASGNPINSPETGAQIEGGVKANLLDNNLNATFSVFSIEKKNVIQSAGGGVSVLSGAEKSNGAEVEIDAEPLPNWKIIAGYAYVDAHVSDDLDAAIVGLRLRNAPVHTASVFTRYDIDGGPLDGLGFSLGVNYASKRYGNLPTTGTRLDLPGYTVVDAGIYYKKGDFSTSLQFKNLLDKTYYESATSNTRITPGAPASVVLSAKFGF